MNTQPQPYSLGVILFVVFLVLKLTHHIGWSWLWVTSPLWIPAAIALVLVVAGLGFFSVTRK